MTHTPLTRRINKTMWRQYFRDQGPRMQHSQCAVSTLDLNLDQLERLPWTRFDRIGLASDSDRFVIKAGSELLFTLDDLQAISTMEDPPGQTRGLELIDAAGIRHIIAIRYPKPLSA